MNNNTDDNQNNHLNNDKNTHKKVCVKDYALSRIRMHLTGRIEKALMEEMKQQGVEGADIPEIQLRIPPPNVDAQFALPCFAFAKALKKSPAVIAQSLADRILTDNTDLVDKLESDKGYLNFYINRMEMTQEIFNDFQLFGDDYGSASDGFGKTIVIDFSSPNIAKPFSVGNIRSTIIGSAIYKIYKSLGYKVVGDNHLGDWGTQFGKLLYAYELWGNEEQIKQDPINELLKLYVRFHQESSKHKTNTHIENHIKNHNDEEALETTGGSSMEAEARKRFKRLEDGDPDMIRLWKWFVDLSLKEFNKIYDRLGVDFDYALGESFFIDKTGEIIETLEKSGIAKRGEDNSLIVPLDKEGIDTPLLLQKQDGATLYATRDLAGLVYRIREFNPVMILYVVGSEQKLHFKQCFKVLEMMGYDTKCIHVEFGMVSLKEGKMSTREGRVVFFENLLDEAVERIRKFLNENRTDLSEQEKNLIAETVGTGAVIFNDLFQHRIKNVVFDWDKMLSFDGDTAPYLQYSYARVQSILRKASQEGVFKPQLLKEDEEFQLIGKLAQFPDIIKEAADNFTPHTLAQYLIDTAKVFTTFYNKVPVLNTGCSELTRARLELIKAYSQVIKKGLSLLGIKTLGRM